MSGWKLKFTACGRYAWRPKLKAKVDFQSGDIILGPLREKKPAAVPNEGNELFIYIRCVGAGGGRAGRSGC